MAGCARGPVEARHRILACREITAKRRVLGLICPELGFIRERRMSNLINGLRDLDGRLGMVALIKSRIQKPLALNLPARLSLCVELLRSCKVSVGQAGHLE